MVFSFVDIFFLQWNTLVDTFLAIDHRKRTLNRTIVNENKRFLVECMFNHAIGIYTRQLIFGA